MNSFSLEEIDNILDSLVETKAPSTINTESQLIFKSQMNLEHSESSHEKTHMRFSRRLHIVENKIRKRESQKRERIKQILVG